MRSAELDSLSRCELVTATARHGARLSAGSRAAHRRTMGLGCGFGRQGRGMTCSVVPAVIHRLGLRSSVHG